MDYVTSSDEHCGGTAAVPTVTSDYVSGRGPHADIALPQLWCRHDDGFLRRGAGGYLAARVRKIFQAHIATLGME